MASIGKLSITGPDNKELLVRSRSYKLAKRVVLRAKIILACAIGMSYDTI
tara:strand:- start:2702 stop:2851 length:150 start_codon:yes stop_codon:yes gene_type:complete